MATLADFRRVFKLEPGLLQPKALAAMYSGPIAQQVADSMQADMDTLVQGEFTWSAPTYDYGGVGNISVPTEADKCIEFRKNYFNDMQGNAEEFERFEDNFSFKKPYTSEDPIESFTSPPSSHALEAFLQF
jgi:hypothetical protein